jgi:hypothetical protein
MRHPCLFVAWFFLIAPLAAQEAKLDPDHAAKMAKGLELFKKQVRPVLEAKCLRCHGGGKMVESDLDLADREGLLKGGQAGPAIVVGKSKESLLLRLINHAREPHMPRGGDKLPVATIHAFAEWIDLGAPYDSPLVANAGTKIHWTKRVVPEEAKEHWAFAPLSNPQPPDVRDPAWVKTPVDRFILHAMEAKGVRPNPAASKTTLLRRAYLDLLGLPPTPHEIETFLQDTSEQAWPRLIDRLLESPHYGERWARHWLDLARFAESHGFEHDYDRPSAYHYRDFVIEAFNRDLPFNTFVKWQLAGDEYLPDEPLALKATGFLAAGVHSTQITKAEVEKHRYDELDDKLATVGTAMLGLTIGCARCHDHKYDPIPSRDYYRMLASFTTTVRSEVDLVLNPGEHHKARLAFQEAHAAYETAVRQYEATRLARRFAEWEASEPQPRFTWEIPPVAEVKTSDGAKLQPQRDGSLLASGPLSKSETYTITLQTRQKGIKALRIEALADGSLPKNGPGRAGNGNFALSNVAVAVRPLKNASAKPLAVALTHPRATFEQKGLPVKAAIDSDNKTAWAIDGQIGRDHAAVFDFASPVGFDEGTLVTVTLRFSNNDGHHIGRPRVALASEPVPEDLRAPGITPEARDALAFPAEQRSFSQKQLLLEWFKPLDAEWLALERARLAHLAKAPQPKTAKALIASEGLPAVRLHSQGEDFFPETYFLRRGDVEQKEGVAAQGFLQVLMPADDMQQRWQSKPPAGSRTSYRRRALAEWITDTERGAGALLARVIVNRLWQHHMGQGIVATPSDFGLRGEKPSHPELLEFLAAHLRASGWSLKAVHRLIMTSAVYQQSALDNPASAKLDHENRTLWRFPARRLEAEVIRDAMLAVSGQLDPKMFGPGTLDPASKRRSIYFTVKRSKLVPMMVIFDAPDALTGMAQRPTTTIAPQALHLLNSAQSREHAKGLAERLKSTRTPEEAIDLAYRIALSRAPHRDEREDALAFMQQQAATYPPDRARQAALVDFCHVLLCLNEFVYLN